MRKVFTVAVKFTFEIERQCIKSFLVLLVKQTQFLTTVRSGSKPTPTHYLHPTSRLKPTRPHPHPQTQNPSPHENLPMQVQLVIIEINVDWLEMMA